MGNPDTIGRYQVLERIGGGAMGTVYRAHDPQIGRTIAIKVLNDQDLHARFRQEVRTAGTLTHPNIVAIYDYGEANGLPFIVMEYVEGRTLADLLRDRIPLTLPYKIRLMQQLCAALDYAHARGVVHRDIKPANLMLDHKGDLKVVDFGIAKMGDAELTRTGSVLGTLTYMSPEQIEGGQIDRRSDIFSVGVVLYEVMSSFRAFQGETPSQIIRAILNDHPVGLAERCPELDPAFDRIVRKALHKTPSERYQTLAELSADLGRITIAPAGVPAMAGVRADDPTGTLLVDRASRRPTTAAPPVSQHAAQPPMRRAWGQWAWIGLAIAAGIVALGTGVRLAMLAFSTSSETTAVTRPVPTEKSTVTTTPVTPAPTEPGPEPVITKETPVEVTPTERPKKLAITEPNPKPKIEDRPREIRETLTQQAAAIMASNPSSADQARAAELYRKACDAGEAPGCQQGGVMYRDNAFVRDLTKAMQLFERACEGGIAPGCTSLGTEYARGVAVAKDEAKAATLFKRACDGNGLLGCDSLGRAYQAGRGVPRDEVMARSLYQKACDGGAPVGCLNLGLMLVRGQGGPADEARGVSLFERACDGGNTVGCGNLGLAYARGTNVPRDDAKAVSLYQRACDAGGAPSCANLAGMYSSGRGVTRDLGRAAVLLERACDGNYAEGCEQLAQRYERGAGVARDPARAADLLRRANQLRGTTGATTGGTTTGGTTTGGSVSGGVVGGVVGGITEAPPPPPPPPSKPVRIGGDIKPPVKTRHVEPVFPAIAQSARVRGVVILEATIGPNGKVTDAHVLRSIPLLDQAAIDAVKQWEFTPTIVKGVAVPVLMTVTVTFSLN